LPADDDDDVQRLTLRPTVRHTNDALVTRLSSESRVRSNGCSTANSATLLLLLLAVARINNRNNAQNLL